MGEKGEKRKQELLKITYRMFIQKGYEQTSVDDIIAEAKIAKGTYYYYFPGKETALEEVINMMISNEVKKAEAVLSAPIPVPQKLAGIITSLRPGQDEGNIADVLNRPENILMHEKTDRRIVAEAVPLLAKAVYEGIEQGLFNCDHVEERVKMILIMSQSLFDGENFTAGDIEVFIDIAEKTLGTQPGTLEFIRELIN